jgi:hypothetical protein
MCMFSLAESIVYSSLNEQVSVTGNSSIYTFRASRFDNQVKYECQILNQALTVPIRLENYLHIKCKNRTITFIAVGIHRCHIE